MEWGAPKTLPRSEVKKQQTDLLTITKQVNMRLWRICLTFCVQKPTSFFLPAYLQVSQKNCMFVFF